MKKTVLLAFVLVLLSTAVVVGFIRPVIADGTIYIRADGRVEGTTLISSVDNVTYTFTDNIYDEIVVERDNIVVDGAGYTLQGTGTIDSRGIYLSGRSNVTIKNMEIKAFSWGIYISYSSNNTVSGNNITNNSYAIGIGGSSNNTISGNKITNNGDGVVVASSSFNTVSGNNIKYGSYGVWLYMYSSNNTFFGNNITDNGIGIFLQSSDNNILYVNNITNNWEGIWLSSSSNNRFYHNNFIDNTQQVYISTSGYANFWDDGVEGNYWSNYTGVDSDHGGIGDNPHEIDTDNLDNYPLMGTFSIFKTPLGLYVNVISNSTIDDFEFFESNSTIKMYVSNTTLNQIFGFCRVSIPKNLMSPPYTVIINDEMTSVLYFNGTVYDNGTHRWIYFAYEHSTHKVEIIPEFPTWASILLILIVLTVTIAIYKRKLLKTPIH